VSASKAIDSGNSQRKATRRNENEHFEAQSKDCPDETPKYYENHHALMRVQSVEKL
jgi:hypothetical protein